LKHINTSSSETSGNLHSLLAHFSFLKETETAEAITMMSVCLYATLAPLE